jgi:chromosome segregation ATPase
VLSFFAVTVGIAIHFVITSRRNLKSSSPETEKSKQAVDEWKLKYFNEIEKKEKDIEEIRSQLLEAQESDQIHKEQIEELRRQQKRTQSEVESTHKATVSENKPNYIDQLRIAQASLLDHNEKINQLLENIDLAWENEERQKLMEEENDGLMNQVKDLKYILSEKEIEIHNIRQKENLTKEMTSMLDSAYSEFNTMQSKMQKLESQLSSSKMISLEYEDLKEAHLNVTHEYEDYKIKLQAMTAENQQLTLRLNEVEDKFREANFQRQQLQKRVGYLEELNNDLQVLADANKKLEHQLRRIGELESMLNVVSEENQFLKRQVNQ